MNHLETSETIARLLYDGDRKYALTKEEITALEWAIKTMRWMAKERKQAIPQPTFEHWPNTIHV